MVEIALAWRKDEMTSTISNFSELAVAVAG